MDDEATLIQAAQRDPAAFGPLYARYLDRIYAYLWLRTAREEDAADLTQQVFVRALDALASYRRQEVPFAAWLFPIARNTAIDWHRRQRPTVPWESVPEVLHPAVEGTVERDLLRQEAVAHLDTLLVALEPETREALLLRFTAQLTLAEIGVVLGKSAEATRKQITRALHRLKEQYDDDSW
jgi:RNA polymerase sigma-70 factor (ECF subfamily)